MTTVRTPGSILAPGGFDDRIGGHAGLDLVNTVSWRADESRRTDRLVDAAGLLVWCRHAGLVPSDGPAAAPPSPAELADAGVDEQVLAWVRELREHTWAMLDAVIEDAPIPAADELAVRTAIGDVLAHGDRPVALPMRPAAVDLPVGASVVHAVKSAVFDLFVLQDLTNLRRCRGDGCGWVFIDRTRNHSRRWCASNDCGNRFRVRQFSRRQRMSRAAAG